MGIEFGSEQSIQPAARYRLRLFIAGFTPRSMKAVSIVRAVCDEHIRGRYSLQIIDLYEHPELARRAQVVAAPTLVRLLPRPRRVMVGDMSQPKRLLRGLGISV